MTTSLIGQSLGRYHILEQLGEGGMATVYKAYDTRLEADVAVKVIRTENLAPSLLERSLKRFEREAKSLARLTHPNIVKVTDYGEHEGRLYLVMPYLPGGTLKQKLGKSLSWQEAVRLLLPIARALDFAHRQNMIHRDVKPANILITADGETMLTDFGIAKILDLEETSDLTGTGMGIGTPEYMAPEQWTGQTTSQSDQYSLGVVLYELLTGRKPYTADTPAAILLKQATEPLSRPSQFARDMPDKVEKLLLKALARNPADRYADMGAFSAALESLISGQVTPAKLQPAPKRELTQTVTELVVEEATVLDTPMALFNTAPKKKIASRRSWLVAVGLLLVVLVALGILVVFLVVAWLYPLEITFTGPPATAKPTLLLPTQLSQQSVQPSPLPQSTQQIAQPTIPPSPVPQSNRFFKENFDGNADNWKPFVTNGELGQLSLSVNSGYYVFDFSALQVWGYAIYTPEIYSDVRIDAVAENRGNNNNNITLVCRYSETDGWYEASIANNGLWWLYYGKWNTKHTTASYVRIYDGGSNDIRQGKDVNTYTLICKGRTITLMINGIEVHTLDDNKYVLREGNVGVGVSSFNTLPIKVEFDSVEISQP